MKVLMINSVSGYGSTGRICTDLAEVLHENGHKCEIAYGRESVPDKYRDISYRIGSAADVKMHALASRMFDRSGFYSKKATKALIEEIDRFQPDVIHLHNLHGYYLNIEILFEYLAKTDIPVVWTLHDCWAFTGHCAYFSTANCDHWKTGCHHCPQKTQYPSSYLCDHSKQNYENKRQLFTSVRNMTLVTPSEWLAGIVRTSFLGKYPVRVIRNGIDLSVFHPTDGNFREKYALQGKKIILGVASVWDERKGFDDFLKLAELIDEQTRIVLVGVNKKQISRLPKNIIGIERTNNVKELAQIYTTADVFVNPSREETMGLTTVEAMACGTPVVVSDLTAVPEVVTFDCGVIVSKLTTEALKDAIEKVLKMNYNPRTVAQMYDKKDRYLQYLALYLEMAVSSASIGKKTQYI